MARPALSVNSYLYIEGNRLKIFNDNPESEPTYIPTNFCPLCGRRLDPE